MVSAKTIILIVVVIGFFAFGGLTLIKSAAAEGKKLTSEVSEKARELKTKTEKRTEAAAKGG